MTRALKTWRTWTAKEERRLEDLRLSGLSEPRCALALSPVLRLRPLPLRAPRPVPPAAGVVRPVLAPHDLAGVAARAGVTYGAVKSAKRRLRRAGCFCPDATRKER